MRPNVRGLHEPLAGQGLAAVTAPASSRGSPGNPELRRQSLEIILDVLSDSEPVRADVRARLLQQLAENPGRPEQALLDHLRDPDIRKGIEIRYVAGNDPGRSAH